MNAYEIAEELVRSHGYQVHGRLPSGWILRSPDGRLIQEHQLDVELERITTPMICAKCKGKVDETRPTWKEKYATGKHVPLCSACWGIVYRGVSSYELRKTPPGDRGEGGGTSGSWDNAVRRVEGD